ncbi:hypothetical protein T4B_8859, partial [Trichinella pseudospiralis]
MQCFSKINLHNIAVSHNIMDCSLHLLLAVQFIAILSVKTDTSDAEEELLYFVHFTQLCIKVTFQKISTFIIHLIAQFCSFVHN